MDDKRCARCRKIKPRSEFYKNRRWNDGLHPYCKPCLLAYQRDSRLDKLDAADPGRQKWAKWSLESDYFHKIDQPLKAYLLGLLAADGNVLERVPRVTLELAVKDIELVELFRDALAPELPVRRRPPRGHSSEHAVVAIASAELAADLATWGVVPRKTWSYTWPRHLPSEMQRPYLLGHFDGDGFITIARWYRGRPYGRWGLLGTRSFLEGAMSFISEATGIKPRTVHPKPGVHSIHINGVDALTVDEWLHRGLPFGLERKRLSRLLAAA